MILAGVQPEDLHLYQKIDFFTDALPVISRFFRVVILKNTCECLSNVKWYLPRASQGCRSSAQILYLLGWEENKNCLIPLFITDKNS